MNGKQQTTPSEGPRAVAQIGDDPEVLKFSEECHKHSLMPGWEAQSVIGNEPVSAKAPYRWSWADVLRPLMLRAYDVLDPVKAERRNLVMKHPAFVHKQSATTHTLTAAIQGVLPGEIAPAHRHTAAAVRFVIEGRGAFTVVNGEPCHMSPGDLILTPQWCWHDHANETGEPIIWLDVLDVPFIFGIHQWFFEILPGEIQPRSNPGANYKQYGTGIVRPVNASLPASGHSPLFVYPWDRTEPALRELAEVESSDGMVTVEYNNPATGGPVLPTLACYAHMLRPGGRSIPRRTTASAVVHVVKGRGVTIAGDHEVEWETGDVVAVPHWTCIQYQNHSTTEPAFLFSTTDTPILQAFSLYRDERFVSGEIPLPR